MNTPLEIRYLKTAEKDMDDIFDYIAKDNPLAAVSLLEKFDNSILKLAHNPESGIVPKDDRLKKLGYRILIIRNYLIFYVIKPKTVQIRRVIHGARQYSNLL